MLRNIKEWSSTKINKANYCRRAYFLKYIIKDKALLPSSYRRGTLLHEIAEHFWDQLGKSEDIKRDKHGKIKSKKKYSNPGEFVKYAQGSWMRMCMQDEMAGRNVEWAYEDEKWIIRNKYLPEVCSPLFDFLAKEEPPLYTESKFKFALHGRIFTGKIDCIRKAKEKIRIRDYKSEFPWMKGMKLAGNPQLTLYCVGLCALCYADENVAKKLGLLEERLSFMGNPRYTSEKIMPEFFMFGALPIISKPEEEKKEWEKEMQVIYETERTDKDFYELLIFIDDVEKNVEQFLKGEKKFIHPAEKGKKCDACDMRVACLRREEEELNENHANLLKDTKGQLFFPFASPYREPKRTIIYQPRIKWKRKK